MAKRKNKLAWRIGIQHPLKNREEIVGFVEVFDTSIVTSASYERFFNIQGKKFSHIINPKSGYPVEDCIASITVVDSNSTFADAMSTALYAMGLKKAINFIQDFKSIEAILITTSKEI